MPSQDEGWGYDVSDYTRRPPRIGRGRWDELIAKAGERGHCGVLSTGDENHTSAAPPWFADARSGREAAHRRYDVWGTDAGRGRRNNCRLPPPARLAVHGQRQYT